MPTPIVRPYGFDKGLEQAIAFYTCTSPQFYGRVGTHIEVDALSLETSRLLVQAAHVMAKERGKGPDSSVLVLQRLNRWMDDGKIDENQVLDCQDLLDDATREGLPSEGSLIDELVPVFKKRMHFAAAKLANKRVADGNEDMDGVSDLLSVADTMGDADVVDMGTALGDDAFTAISEMRGLIRLPTGIPDLDVAFEGGLPKGQLGVAVGDTGDGKCHAAGQGILMYDGRVKKVEDILPGDTLMGAGGSPRTVLRVNSGYGRMYDVVPKDGAAWRVNADHVLSLVHTNTGEVVDVSVSDWLRWPVGMKHLFKLFRSNMLEFGCDRLVLPLEPYFLGVLLGDGSFSGYDIRVTTADDEVWLEVQRQCLKFGLKLGNHALSRTAPSYSLAGTKGKKNPIARALEHLGLRGAPCGSKHIPQVYKVASREDRLALLAGLIDTDGARNKSAYDLVFKSRALADDLCFVARSLGFRAVVKPCKKACQTGAVGTYYRVGISGDVREIPVRLERKRVSVRKQKKDPLRVGFSIREAPIVERYYGFTLAGDGRYLLDDFTVTHNSMFLAHVGASAFMANKRVAYATLELPRPLVLARLIANISGIPINALVNGHIGDARTKLNKIAGRDSKLVVREFTPQATKVSEIFDWVDKEADNDGKKIDLLLVDYADKLQSDKRDEDGYTGMRRVYEGLRIGGVQRDLWQWTASQSRRKDSKSKKKVKDINDLADSQHKARVADVVITLNVEQQDLDDELLEVTFFIAKNRTGQGRRAIGPLVTDFSCGRMVVT